MAHPARHPSSQALRVVYDHLAERGVRAHPGAYFSDASNFRVGTLVGTRTGDTWTVRPTRAMRTEIAYGPEETFQIEDPRESSIGFGLMVTRKSRPLLHTTLVDVIDPAAEAEAVALEARLNASELANARWHIAHSFPWLSDTAAALGTVRELRGLYSRGKRQGLAAAA